MVKLILKILPLEDTINNLEQKDKLKTEFKFRALFLGKSKLNVDYSFATKNTLTNTF